MKTLDVPIFLQPDGSLDCGPASVKMILKYFDTDRELEELRSKLFYNEIGTTIFDNASLFLDEGLATEIITAQPILFPPDVAQTINSEKDVLNIVNVEMAKKDKFFDNYKTWVKYINKGGKIQIDIPNFEHIKNAIGNSNPVMALVHAGGLGSKEGTFHFVVICGYNNNKVLINNAYPHSSKQAWFPIKRFLFALHSSTCADIDNGSLLIVSKKWQL